VKKYVGFTLIEVAVVLAISAAIGLAIWRLLPAMRGTVNADASRIALAQAQQALDGFIGRNHRLPCPASAAGGVENCGAGGLLVGTLPYATLGLSEGMNLRYGVYQNTNGNPVLDANLTRQAARFVPLASAPIVSPINGLDFCVGVKNAIANAAPVLHAGSANVPIAYALAHAGGDGVFNGLNATAANFELSAQPASLNYDDQVLTTGLSELFGRLACPERLAHAEGAARAAFAAYDINRNAQLYQDFRGFAVRARTNTRNFAIAKLAIATVDLAVAVAAQVTAVALAAEVAPLAAPTLAGAVLAIAAATAAEALAATAVGLAQVALDKEIDQKGRADQFQVGTAALYLKAFSDATKIKAQGLQP
jgi:type II secretory pathway pseudopilin PulG